MNIINFPSNVQLKDNLGVEKCLDQAKKVGLSKLFIAGYTNDGKYFFSSENANNEEVIFLNKITERYVLKDIYE